MSVRQFSIQCLIFFVFCACGHNSKDNPHPRPQEDQVKEEEAVEKKVDIRGPGGGGGISRSRFLIYAGTDVLFSSNSINILNLETLANTVLLTGQSRDLVIRESNGRVFAVNRQPGFQDIREIILSKEGEKAAIRISEPISLSALAPGDPHDLAMIDEEHVFIAAYNGKASFILNLETKDLNEIFSESEPQRIETVALWGDEKILTLRQGLSRDFSVNGSQVLEIRKRTVRDLPLLGSVSLRTSIPIGLFPTKHVNVFQTVTFCATFFVNCRSGLESIDLENEKSELQTSFDADGLSFYGPTVQLENRDEIYAAVMKNDSKDKFVTVIDQTYAKSTRKAHSFPNNKYSGYWGIFSDRDSDTLIIADALSETKGTISIQHATEPPKSVELPNIPASGKVMTLRHD